MKHKCKCKLNLLLCEHKHVSYCKECEKVHCIDCGKEWPDDKETTFIPYNPPYYFRPWDYVPPSPSWNEPYYPQITWGGDIETITNASPQHTLT